MANLSIMAKTYTISSVWVAVLSACWSKVSSTLTSIMQANGRLKIRLCVKKVSFLWLAVVSRKRGRRKVAGKRAGHPTGGVPTAFFLCSSVLVFSCSVKLLDALSK